MNYKGWVRHLDFMTMDVAASVVSLLILFSCYGIAPWKALFGQWRLILFIAAVHFVLSIIIDNYNGVLQRGYAKEFFALFKLMALLFVVLVVAIYYLGFFQEMPRRILFFYFLIAGPLTYIARILHKFRLRRYYKDVKNSRQIVVIATEQSAQKLVEALTRSAIRNYHFFGLAVMDRPMVGEKIGEVTVDADSDSLISYLRDKVVDEAFIDLPDDSKQAMALSTELLDMGIEVHLYLEEPYKELPNRRISNVFGCNVLSSTIVAISFRKSLIKRLLDIIGSLFGCLATLILMIIFGPMIWIASPGPIFFKQDRVGKNGRIFKLYKFRSMYMDAEERKKELMKENELGSDLMFKIKDDPRIIKGIGHFIRKTSIDEFPQFFNVLKGDMALVGTRPPTVDEYNRYSPHHKKRLSMRPGITGLWQTSGRSKITDFEEVVRLDAEYIENSSITLDIKILLKTALQILGRKEDSY